MEVNKPNQVAATGEPSVAIEMTETPAALETTDKPNTDLLKVDSKLKDSKQRSSLHISQALTTSEAGIVLHKSKPIHVDLSGKEDDNFKYMLAYPKSLACLFFGGCISLLGGSVAQFAVPGVLGLVVDQMNARKEYFSIQDDGTRVYIDKLDPKTKLTIKGEDKFNEATTLIGIYCFYMMIVCIASSIAVWHRAYTFNMMSEKIA